MNQAFEELMATAVPEAQALSRAAKSIIEQVMPNVVEVVWLNQKK